MKRTQLLRKTPLKASKPMRRSKPIRQRSRKHRPTSPEDRARLDWLHTLPCCAPGAPSGCRFDPTVHHDTQDRGLATRSPHARGIPMCRQHHVYDFHGNAGPFKGWKQDQLRAWQTTQVAKYQALWEQRQAGAHHEAMAFE